MGIEPTSPSGPKKGVDIADASGRSFCSFEFGIRLPKLPLVALAALALLIAVPGIGSAAKAPTTTDTKLSFAAPVAVTGGAAYNTPPDGTDPHQEWVMFVQQKGGEGLFG